MSELIGNHTHSSRVHQSNEKVRLYLHDLQNHLHVATMELELAQLDPEKRVDCDKLLQILNSLKQSLLDLKEHLMATPEMGDVS